MPASCRVRRSASVSSPYPLLRGAQIQQTEDNEISPNVDEGAATLQPAATTPQPGPNSTVRRDSGMPRRPRSQTLSSLFGEPPSTDPRQTSPLSGRGQPRSTEGEEEVHIVRRPTLGLVAGHLSSYRSQLPLHVTDPTESSRPSMVAGQGSQVDVLIPHETQPGLVGSALSHVLDDEMEHHEDNIVEHLEVIDPHVAAVSHLSNAANSILIPPMSLYSRRPVIHLPRSQSLGPEDLVEKVDRGRMDDLDRHIEHVLSRRDKVRRTAAGIWSFVKTPMGVITAIYGFLVVFWGAAIVFFLANFIPTGSKDRQGFWVEVSSQVENALFTVTGIGLVPWRIRDTYRILLIWNLKRVSTRLRKKAGLPELHDEDDLPDPQYDPNFVHVLTDEQQKQLQHQQKQFAKSQTWYRPHGTDTHRAFPIGTALLICLFVDGNSIFQAILCGCMWGLDRFERPAWTTGTLIPASFMCGIIGAILIWKGGQKTKRTKEVETRLRAALEAERGAPADTVAIANQPSTDVQMDETSMDKWEKHGSPTIDEDIAV